MILCRKAVRKRAADGRNGDSDDGKGRSERRKTASDGGFRGGNCHAENGVLITVFATILGKNFFLPRAQKFPREHDKRDK